MPAPPLEPKRYFVVVNPKAGRGKAARHWLELSGVLEWRALDYQVVFSELKTLPETLRAIRALPQDTAVVAVGGDGTLRSLLQAVIGSGRPLSLVPLGRGNDLAAALGWKSGDLDGAVARLTQPANPLDVLEVRFFGETHYSLNGIGMGFDAQVTARAVRTPRFLGGFGQYAVGALLSVAALRSVGLEVSVDGERVFSGESFLSAVMNGSQYGGGFLISPRSCVNDGLADVLVGHRVSRLGLLPLMLRVLRGKHLDHTKVSYRQGQWVTLRWAEPLPLHLDGDLFPAVAGLEVRVLPSAIRLLGVDLGKVHGQNG